MLLAAASCLRTPDGGCGGPATSPPCECDLATTPIAVPGEGLDPDQAGGSARGGTVVVHAEVEPAHLQPLLRPDAWCERIVSHDVYEALLRQDPFTHELTPELAESFDVSEDGLTLTFHLRQDVRWHDGTPFTSGDVLFTFSSVRDPAVLAATARSNIEGVASFDAPDDYTFRIVLREQSYVILRNLDSIVIIPRHVFGRGDINSHPNLRRPVGTGPFRFESWRPGRDIVLERNDDYWREPPHLDRVVYRFARDRTLALQMAKRGDVDLLPRLSSGLVSQVREDEDLRRTHELQTYFAPGYSFLVYNTRRALFREREVRRALSMLVDRSTMLCALQDCLGQVISGPFPVGHPGAAPTVEPLPFDPAGARALLERAGWDEESVSGIRTKGGRRFRFTLLVPAVSVDSQRMASLMQEDMLRAGVRMEIHAVDWAVFLQRLQEHDFDAAALQFSLDWDTDYSSLFHSSQAEGGMNYGAWEHPRADDLLDALRRELRPERRVELLRALHHLLHAEQPQTFLLARVESSLINRNIRGAVPGVPWYDERTWWLPEAARDSDGRPAR